MKKSELQKIIKEEITSVLKEGMTKLPFLIKDKETDPSIIKIANELGKGLKKEGFTVWDDNAYYYPNFTLFKVNAPAMGFNIGSDNHYIIVLKTKKLIKTHRGLIETALGSNQLIGSKIVPLNLYEQVNESYDLDAVKYSASVKSQVDKLVSAIEKTPNLTKTAVASIFNDIILALGLNKTEISMILNAIKIDRTKYKF